MHDADAERVVRNFLSTLQVSNRGRPIQCSDGAVSIVTQIMAGGQHAHRSAAMSEQLCRGESVRTPT